MKKKYVCPQIDIISTKMEDALLKVSGGEGTIDNKTHAKTYDFDQSDFSDESLWNDEIDDSN